MHVHTHTYIRTLVSHGFTVHIKFRQTPYTTPYISKLTTKLLVDIHVQPFLYCEWYNCLTNMLALTSSILCSVPCNKDILLNIIYTYIL